MRSSSKVVLAAGAATLVLAIGGSVALATTGSATAGFDTRTTTSPSTASTTTRSSETSARPAPTLVVPAAINADEAARIAVARLGGGRAVGIEQEVEHGRLEWKVDVLTVNGERVRVRVDASNGTITRIEPGDSGGDDGRRGDGDRGGDDRGGDDRGGNSGRH